MPDTASPAKQCSTPGPWRKGNLGYVYATDGKHQVLVARVGDFRDKELIPQCRERWTADAHLIAAAPMMYDALQLCIPVLERLDTLRHLHPDFPALDEARAATAKAIAQTTRAAIARATGEQP